MIHAWVIPALPPKLPVSFCFSFSLSPILIFYTSCILDDGTTTRESLALGRISTLRSIPGTLRLVNPASGFPGVVTSCAVLTIVVEPSLLSSFTNFIGNVYHLNDASVRGVAGSDSSESAFVPGGNDCVSLIILDIAVAVVVAVVAAEYVDDKLRRRSSRPPSLMRMSLLLLLLVRWCE